MIAKKMLVLASVVFLLLAGLAFAGPKDVVVLTPKKGNVTFKHKEHNDRLGANQCKTCHHKNKDDGSDAKKCRDCHKKKKDGDKPKLKKAMHKRCQGCHKTEKKAGKPAGPTRKCKECHKK